MAVTGFIRRNAATVRRSLLLAVNSVGRVVDALRPGSGELQADRLMQAAARRTGLDDFGPSDFIEPLSRLLASMNGEAQLTFIGRLAMREDIVHTLAMRLQIEADRRRLPALAEAPVESPIFVTGLPRSGTTLLHNLLAEDSQLRAPRGWEVMYPSPPPGTQPDQNDPRHAKAQKRMQQLYWLAPDFRVIHPLDAAQPQECISMTGYAFMSDVFVSTCHIPAYQRWLDDTDQRSAYDYHKRFLQQLQGGHALRWVLKAPAHLFSLKALLAVYPDARIVLTHRDPLQVLPSLANLTRVLRNAFSEGNDAQAIGEEELQRWSAGLRRALEFLHSLPDRGTRVADVYYRDLVEQPLPTLAKLYQQLGLLMNDAQRDKITDYLQRFPKNRYGRHCYSLEQFELTPARVDEAFAFYRRDYPLL